MKNNSVHLDGFLEGFRVLSRYKDRAVAWASVVTLHPKSMDADIDSVGSFLPSEKYHKLHHQVQIVSGKEDMYKLDSLQDGFRLVRDGGSLYPCGLDGFLSSEGNDTFVVCNVADFRKLSEVMTNDNNLLSLTGEVVYAAAAGDKAKVSIKNDRCTIDSLISRKAQPDFWEMVAFGKISKGDTLQVSGPLLSGRFTANGKDTVNVCTVSPRKMEVVSRGQKISRKGGQSI